MLKRYFTNAVSSEGLKKVVTELKKRVIYDFVHACLRIGLLGVPSGVSQGGVVKGQGQFRLLTNFQHRRVLLAEEPFLGCLHVEGAANAFVGQDSLEHVDYTFHRIDN